MAKAPSDIFLAAGKVQQRTASAMPAFPLVLCLTALATNGLALTAGFAGVQWGAGQPAPDALQCVLIYVQISVSANWFLVWPAFVLRGGGSAPDYVQRVVPRLWQLVALVIAAVPAWGVALWLAGIPFVGIACTLCLQGCYALFALGLLTRAWSGAMAQARAGILSAVLFLALPLLAYVQAEFFPALADGWWIMAPPLALRAAAIDVSAGLWWQAVLYGLAGFILLVLPQRAPSAGDR